MPLGIRHPNLTEECGFCHCAYEERRRAHPWGLLQSTCTAPIRPPHHQPCTWLLRREGVTSTQPCLARGPDAAARMGKCAAPRATARRTSTRRCFVSERACAALGADTETVCASLPLGDLQPPHYIPSRSMGSPPRIHPLNSLTGLGGLPPTHLRLSGDPSLRSMDAMCRSRAGRPP